MSVEKSEEKSQQKSKPESPKLEATKPKIVNLEPPAKPERHLRPDTKASKPEVLTSKPEVTKKESEIEPDVKPKLSKVRILNFLMKTHFILLYNNQTGNIKFQLVTYFIKSDPIKGSFR